MEFYAELGGTEQGMKDEFAAAGLNPEDVDYLEDITAYDIDSDTKTDENLLIVTPQMTLSQISASQRHRRPPPPSAATSGNTVTAHNTALL